MHVSPHSTIGERPLLWLAVSVILDLSIRPIFIGRIDGVELEVQLP